MPLLENLNLEKKSNEIPHVYIQVDGSVSFASNGQTAIFEMVMICTWKHLYDKLNPGSNDTRRKN